MTLNKIDKIELHNHVKEKINIRSARKTFQKIYPFNYIVLDDFLPEDLANQLLNEFPNVHSDLWIVGHDKDKNGIKFAKDNPFEKKMLAVSDRSRFPNVHCEVFDYFDSQDFIDLVKKITGIEDLGIDISGKHSGLRGMLNGSHQHVHSDAVTHPITGLRKRLSMLLYLNKCWKTEFNGCLEIWNDEMTHCVEKIEPLFNRLVIFECTEKSYHGVPETINFKNDEKMRMSLITSYMSRLNVDENGRKRAKFVARPNDRNDEEMEKLRRDRSSIDQKNKHRFV